MKKRILLGIAAFQTAAILVSAQAVNPYNPIPTRTIGHARQTPLTTTSPNYVEGRELFSPQGVALDRSTNPPAIYVSDTLNNRVMVWRNANAVAKGAPADLIIGQRDRFSTLPQGPAQSSTEQRLVGGLTSPMGLVVDSQGNLYVTDAGNNRVLRFPKPFEQTSEVFATDLVIGQTFVSVGTSPNRGAPSPSARTLSLSTFSGPNRNGVAFDAQGNLWVSDPGNNRVLRYPPSQLTPNKQDPEADLVLGQNDFVTSAIRPTTPPDQPALNKSTLTTPSGIAFDQAGRLYICEATPRVSVWAPPFRQGGQAVRLLGLVVTVQGQPVPGLNATRLGSALGPPEGVFTIGNNAFVIDTTNNRILRYDTPENWPAETETDVSPAAVEVIGQADFTVGDANRGARGDTAGDRFSTPVAGAVSGSDVWIVDSGNHRVLGFPLSGGSFTVANKVLGQPDLQFRGPNTTKALGFNYGAVFFGNGRLNGAGNVAVDYTSTPPRLYLADTLNNRVLGYRDARNVKVGDSADLVIGQLDFSRNLVNRTGDFFQLSDVGLNSPASVAVDAQGNLWVADTGNARALRFAKPFDQVSEVRANLVLGQASRFGIPQRESTSRTMNAPWGIAFLTDGHVLISDPTHHRVLLFRKPAGGDFTEGQAASAVLGQRDFASASPGAEADKLNFPRLISTDTDDRVYVADGGNNRIVVHRQQTAQQPSGLPGVLFIPASGPLGITVSRETGSIWVAETGSNRVLRYAKFEDLQLQQQFTPDVIFANGPQAVALDPQDNPIITEGLNRLVFHFPRLVFRNSASYANRVLAPGMIAILGKFSSASFNSKNELATGGTWPDSLGDVEVTMNGTKAPIYLSGIDLMYIQVPQRISAPGDAEVIVQRKSTGQVLGASTFLVDVAAPGFYSVNQQGTGPLAAINQDGKINGPGEGARRGEVVSLYGTGIGLVPNAPPDGQPAAGAAPAAGNPQRVVFGNNANVEVQYFGLAPGLIGVFQMNIKVPDNAVPNEANPVAITFRDAASNDGPDGRRLITQVWVR